MARARVPDFEPNLDNAARRFADELLGAANTLPDDKLQRGHARRLFEHTEEVKRTEFHERSQRLDGDVLREVLAHVGVAIAGGQKPTLSKRSIGLPQRSKAFAIELRFYIETIFSVGVDVSIARRREMRDIRLIDVVAFRSELI